MHNVRWEWPVGRGGGESAEKGTNLDIKGLEDGTLTASSGKAFRSAMVRG